MKRSLTLILALLFCISAIASNDTIKAPRPKVGIVFGGGGAKGSAHIGVLKYIEEMGIPVDYVVGTSMGSIIGGLYSLGYSPDELQDLISNLDWSVYITNSVNRKNLSSSEKKRHSTYLLSIPFNSGELGEKTENTKDEVSTSLLSSLPESFMNGSMLLNLFNSLCIGYQDTMDFNNLPIPFACIATEVTTGEEVILRKGKFAEAIRASMAIPGVFDPVTIDGKYLIDGGLVNNFPTDRCREMGADIIIGIEVAQGLVTDQKKLQSLPQLLAQLKNIAVKGHNEENRKLCDVYIQPNVSDYGMLSFNAAAIDSLVKRGYRDAQAFHDQLQDIKNYIDSFEPTRKTLHAPKARYIGNDSIHIRDINMENVSYKEADWLIRKGGLKNESTVSFDDIQEAINTYRGIGCFSRINYVLHPVDFKNDTAKIKTYDLNIAFTTYEPHVFDIGFRYDSEESASLLFNLGLNQRRLSGVKANLSFCLGYNNWLNATATLANLSLANISMAYDFRMTRPSVWEIKNIFQTTSDDYELLMTNNQFFQNRFRIYISEFHLRYLKAAIGLESERITYFQTPNNAIFGSIQNEDHYSNASFGPFTKLRFDNLDDAYFATQGVETSLEAHWRMDKQFKDPDLGGNLESNFGDFCFYIKGYLSKNKFTFIPQLYSRVIIGDNYLYAYHNNIGSNIFGRHYDYQLPFIGMNHSTDLTDAYKCAHVGRADFRYNFYKKNYITAMVNYARTSFEIEDLFDKDYAWGIWGLGLMYSYNSIIGPISLQVHWEDYSNPWGVYVNIGYEF